MGAVSKRTVSLTGEHAAYIDAKVESGDYGSASEVVRAGLRALKERDAAVEAWLAKDVLPVFDAMEDDPARAIALDDVFAGLRARHEAFVRSRT